MTMADSIITFKFAIRSVAKRFGLYATFMPKPQNDTHGSGMHLNITLYQNGKNVFHSDKKGELTPEAAGFIGGILAHAPALCAVTNPIVNSYKRLQTGASAPNRIGYSSCGDNVFVNLHAEKDNTKIELRFPDPSANPYLAFAACFAAGLDGIRNHMDPGRDVAEDEAVLDMLPLVPGTLKEATEAFRKDPLMTKTLGERLVERYCNAKDEEWMAYMSCVSDWEVQQYLHKM